MAVFLYAIVFISPAMSAVSYFVIKVHLAYMFCHVLSNNSGTRSGTRVRACTRGGYPGTKITTKSMH